MNRILILLLIIDLCFGKNLYHGVNVVYKGFPYHPNLNEYNLINSFTEHDMINLHSYNFNVVRLGIMWPGVEPFENYVNNTYLEIMNVFKELYNV